jgi:hypothetical protein
MKTKSQEPSEVAVKCRQAVLDAIGPFREHLAGTEILAILSYTVGQVIAMQDQRNVTMEMLWKLVGANIEAGNAQIINSLARESEGSA